MENLLITLKELLYVFPAILIAFTVHEYAHALASVILGDPTPKLEGRLSLNPFVHLDLVGTLMLIVFKFGWAKPVMINPQYYKHPKRDMGVVAFAGPLANFILAFLSFLVVNLILKLTNGDVGIALYATYTFFRYFAIINLGLGVFNMLPFPPLDGSKVLGAFLPMNIFLKYMQLEPYGMVILVILVFTNLLSTPLNFMLGNLINIFDALTNLMVLM